MASNVNFLIFFGKFLLLYVLQMLSPTTFFFALSVHWFHWAWSIIALFELCQDTGGCSRIHYSSAEPELFQSSWLFAEYAGKLEYALFVRLKNWKVQQLHFSVSFSAFKLAFVVVFLGYRPSICWISSRYVYETTPLMPCSDTLPLTPLRSCLILIHFVDR